MAEADFLIELGCAELPPRALRSLSRAFVRGVENGLDNVGLEHGPVRGYATPRRLAVQVDALQTQQEDSPVEKFGPALKAAYDEQGNPTRAAEGFARSCGVAVEDLETGQKDGVDKLLYRATRPGEPARDLLPAIVQQALERLPVPKKMRWGSSREEFVRPVYWAVMLLGEEVIPARFFDIETGRETSGHRFHHPDPIALARPGDYEPMLRESGYVLADHEARKARIREQVERQAESLSARVIIEEDLLEEVTSLVEWPVALAGRFDEAFLRVPPEALISSLKNHQKCFYLVDDNGQLLPCFIAVSNIESREPERVVAGHERVIRPRLADAAFFFETDCRQRLENRLPELREVVFQKELGSIYDKSARVAELAVFIADRLGADPGWCERAAWLAKTDLVSDMVQEFAELQGIMGYYYARNDGEPEEVAAAMTEQYMPRYAGDTLPRTATGEVLAVAEKLDTITALFAIGQPPTGSKDPFALRRAALGTLRILVDKERDLDLRETIDRAVQAYRHVLKDDPETVAEQVFTFMLERFRAWYQDEGISSDVFQAVHALQPSNPLDFNLRINAVHRFAGLPESEALAAANKRVSNILQKQGGHSLPEVDESLLQEPAERELAESIQSMRQQVTPLFEAREYARGLEKLAGTRDAVDRFFDEVLVMTEDSRLRDNRLALIGQLRELFLQVADISALHGK